MVLTFVQHKFTKESPDLYVDIADDNNDEHDNEGRSSVTQIDQIYVLLMKNDDPNLDIDGVDLCLILMTDLM